jgi:hypothetical protein
VRGASILKTKKRCVKPSAHPARPACRFLEEERPEEERLRPERAGREV